METEEMRSGDNLDNPKKKTLEVESNRHKKVGTISISAPEDLLDGRIN